MKKLVCLILCGAMLFSLCACGGTQVTSEVVVIEEDESEMSSVNDNSKPQSSSRINSVETSNKKIKLTLAGEPVSSYCIVCPNTSLALKEAAMSLANAIKSVTGEEIKISTSCEADFGIYIESTNITGDIPKGYKIAFNGGDLEITGESTAATIAAVSEFAAQISALKTNKDIPGSYKVSKKISYTTIKNTDSKLRYTGRWMNKSGTMVSSWNRASVTICFEGTLLVLDAAVSQNASTNKTNGCLLVSIDGAEETKVQPIGNRIVLNLEKGKHTVVITGTYSTSANIGNFYVEKGATVTAPPDKTHVLFTGSSTTHYWSYCKTASNKLGWDFSVVAQGGMALVDTWGWYKTPDGSARVGTETAFFKNEMPSYTTNLTDFDFKVGEHPDIIVGQLGTNDIGGGRNTDDASLKKFADTYTEFIGKVREKYPNCKFYIMQALVGPEERFRGIELAYKTASAKYKDVYIIPANTWDIEISDDGTHATNAGQQKLGEKLAEYFAKNYK